MEQAGAAGVPCGDAEDGSLLTSILVFCGVGALAAVILALFLGGGRAAIRVLQGKPAATEPEFLRIDLSGSCGENQPEIRGPRAEAQGLTG